MIKNVVFLLLGVVAFVSSGVAQITTPKYSNEFLSIGVGARSLALSNSVTATTDDVTAGYWNPAGLLEIETEYDISFMHSEYFAGIAQYDYLGFATDIDSESKLAISAIRFAIDDIPDTRFLYDANGAINYDNIRFFSSADYAFLFSYARKIEAIQGLKLGGNFKIVHRIAGSFANAWGGGLDLGAQLNRNNWMFGLMLRDALGTYNVWNHNIELVADIYQQTGNELPENAIELTVPKLSAGMARIFKMGEKFSIMPSIDLDFTFDGNRNTLISTSFASIDPKAGLELSYKNKGFIRAGIGKFQEIKSFDGSKTWNAQPSFGLGANLNNFGVDYALSNPSATEVGASSHTFSLRVFFDPKQKTEVE